MITLSPLNDLPGVRHAFFTREGGVSSGVYAGMNCGFGSDDKKDNVSQNRALAMESLDLPPEALVTVYQQHTADCITVGEAFAQDDAPVADAMASNTPGIALGILTADCAPVIFIDAKAKVIGAAHAGWKGALGGVLESTITAMEDLGADRNNIHGAIGPCIQQRSYEVGPDFPEPFLAQDPGHELYFAPSRTEGRFLFDLTGYVARQMDKLAIAEILMTPYDTYAQADRFYSFRRATHRGEADYGRGLSVVVLEP